MPNTNHTTGSALTLAIVIPAVVGLGGGYLSVVFFESFGWALFLFLPLLVTFLSSYIYSQCKATSWPACYGVSLLSILLIGVLILLFAIDGLICLLMALPLAAGQALLGSLFGYLLGRQPSSGPGNTFPGILIACFPLLVAVENRFPPQPPLHAVTTRVAVNAPIQKVWDQVIAFDRIDAPPTGIFRVGIAYPIEAKIEGHGVGAVRLCVFSTGPFVEPITLWDEPHALEFDVTSNPPPMKEWSPWGELDVPHLHHTFVAERGQFRLYEQEGQTIVEGTTWYRQHIYPDFYWHRLSDPIIHRIHLRVLEHIKSRSEQHP